LSVFQTIRPYVSAAFSGAEFQSLDWVERLSDSVILAGYTIPNPFQSLDWVERLSDECIY